MNLTFYDWIHNIDNLLYTCIGQGIHNLPLQNYATLYTNCVSVEDMVDKIVSDFNKNGDIP